MEKKTKKTKSTKINKTTKPAKSTKTKKVKKATKATKSMKATKTTKKELTAKTRKKIVGGHGGLPQHCNIRDNASIEICPREIIDILRLSKYRGCNYCEKNPLHK